MPKRGAGRWIVAGTLGAAGLVATTGVAEPDPIAFPKDYATWEKYTYIHNYEDEQVRELYARSPALQAVREGKSIPDGTVIAMAIYGVERDASGAPVMDRYGSFVKGPLVGISVMEKRKGWGESIPAEYRNGDWQYAAFLPDGTRDASADIQACFTCHLPHAKQDFVISFASLTRKPSPTRIRIESRSFGPATLQVKPGEKITWTNADDAPHQIVIVGKSFDTPVMARGDSLSLTLEEPGTYEYGCALHPGIKGRIEVTK